MRGVRLWTLGEGELRWAQYRFGEIVDAGRGGAELGAV